MFTYILIAAFVALLAGLTGAMPAPMARVSRPRPSDDEKPRDFRDTPLPGQ